MYFCMEVWMKLQTWHVWRCLKHNSAATSLPLVVDSVFWVLYISGYNVENVDYEEKKFSRITV